MFTNLENSINEDLAGIIQTLEAVTVGLLLASAFLFPSHHGFGSLLVCELSLPGVGQTQPESLGGGVPQASGNSHSMTDGGKLNWQLKMPGCF